MTCVVRRAFTPLALLMLLFGFAPLARASDDVTTLAAAIQEKCLRCHGPKKKKGGLRFDVAKDIEGEVEFGAAPDSECFRRVTLGKDHEDHMPPIDDDGNAEAPDLSPDEILALMRWINSSHDATTLAREIAKQEPRVDTIIDMLRSSSGARVVTLGRSGAASLVRVDYGLAKSPPRVAQLASLGAAADRIIELSLAGRALTPDAWAAIPPLPHLTRLHVERSSITTTALTRLIAATPRLEYLNLHTTEVDAAAIDAIAKLAQLTRLVAYRTPIGRTAIAKLKERRPEVEVTTAESLPDAFAASGPREVLAADASKHRIALLRETAIGVFDVIWEHSIEQIHDLQVLADGHILFQTTWTQLVEIDPRNGRTVWQYDAAKQNIEGDGAVEVHSFRRLPNGRTMVAESGRARIIEVDAEGRLLHRIALVVDHPHSHHDTRLVRPTPTGSYLVAHEQDGVVREYDRDGHVIWQYAVPLFDRERKSGHGPEAWGNQLFCAMRTELGTTLITTGNGHGVIEVDADGQIVWRLQQDDLPSIRLAWVTTIQPLTNGNLIVGNCHAGAEQPQLIELTRDKHVVWRLHDFKRFGNALSNAWIIEDAAAQSASSER